MSLQSITEAVSDLAINFGEGYQDQNKRKPMARPYGVALLLAGVDDNGPQLFQTDPSGTYLQWDARAIGSGGETAMTYIKESYSKDMTLKDAEKMTLQILKQVMEEKINNTNIELAVIETTDRKLKSRAPEYLEEIIKTLS